MSSPKFLLGDSTVEAGASSSAAFLNRSTTTSSEFEHTSPLIVGRVIVAISTRPLLEAQRQAAGFRTATAVVIALLSGLIVCLTIGSWARRVRRLA